MDSFKISKEHVDRIWAQVIKHSSNSSLTMDQWQKRYNDFKSCMLSDNEPPTVHIESVAQFNRALHAESESEESEESEVSKVAAEAAAAAAAAAKASQSDSPQTLSSPDETKVDEEEEEPPAEEPMSLPRKFEYKDKEPPLADNSRSVLPDPNNMPKTVQVVRPFRPELDNPPGPSTSRAQPFSSIATRPRIFPTGPIDLTLSSSPPQSSRAKRRKQ